MLMIMRIKMRMDREQKINKQKNKYNSSDGVTKGK